MARDYPGLFITFEGGEGSGKTTQISLLEEALLTQSIPVIRTYEPGGTDFADEMRRFVKSPEYDIDYMTQLFLLEAARHDHVEKIISPALEEGNVILCDRFFDSSTVYQG
ncbi:MAG: dTMP kinase, partial [Tenericutes bacterium]